MFNFSLYFFIKKVLMHEGQKWKVITENLPSLKTIEDSLALMENNMPSYRTSCCEINEILLPIKLSNSDIVNVNRVCQRLSTSKIKTAISKMIIAGIVVKSRVEASPLRFFCWSLRLLVLALPRAHNSRQAKSNTPAFFFSSRGLYWG